MPAKQKGLSKPKFGGKPKTSQRPPNKKANEALGAPPVRMKAQNLQQSMDKGLGNVERGFIQNTPKKATAAMMGRGLPPMVKSGPKSPTMKGKKSFKPKAGKKVF